MGLLIVGEDPPPPPKDRRPRFSRPPALPSFPPPDSLPRVGAPPLIRPRPGNCGPGNLVDIALIDQRDLAGKMASWRYADPIQMGSFIETMTAVRTRLGCDRLRRLALVDHGIRTTTGRAAQFRDWTIAESNKNAWQPGFQLLKPYFAEEGHIHFAACSLGDNPTLMGMIARAAGVPVFAADALYHGLLKHTFGNYVRVDPSGKVSVGVKHPDRQ